ncbi:MAG: hypothetical protein PVG92_00610 [Holophagae bacterium]|jgi:hypothetical protein
MSRRTIIISLIALLAAGHAVAISPGTDLLIAGAARTATWRSDLYINNPGTSSVLVEVFWLERDQANPMPDSRSFTVGPEETLILVDFIRENFNMNRGEGALRITADGGEVSANLIVYTGLGSENGSLGSGFEAIPVPAATAAGDTTFVMGLAADDNFYTNIFALAGANGVSMNLDLLDEDGAVLDTATLTLAAYEPWLSFRTDIWDVTTFEGTLRAEVTSGSAAILASKIDEISRDPTTLESQFGGGAASADGSYQFAIYDSQSFAAGGNLEIEDDEVTAINGTYFNFEEVDRNNEVVELCALVWQWGLGLEPTDVADFATGVTFTDTYDDDSTMTWTVTFTVDDNMSLAGTIDVEGAGFTGIDEACNRSFSTTTLLGGKSD